MTVLLALFQVPSQWSLTISWYLPYGCERSRKTSARRPSIEGYTIHRLKWGPLPPNEVGKITKHVREEEGLDMMTTRQP